MKTLLLMRHAKSSWDNDALADYARPLNERGRHDAPRMGKLLAQLDLVPNLIVTSGAKRAAKTAELAAAAAGYSGDLRHTDELYLADPDTFLEVARETDDAVACLMLVAHNPGTEELVSALAGRDERMPTAALAAFRLTIEQWADFTDETRAELIGVWRPKEL